MTQAELRALTARYAVVGYGRIVDRQVAFACRNPIIGGVYAIFGLNVDTIYTVEMRRLVRGRAPKRLIVSDSRSLRLGCAPGGTSCGHPFRPGERLWALERLPDGRYEEAGMCSTRLVADALGVTALGDWH